MQLPVGLASFSRNDALCANLLADVPMVAFAVELGISHNGSDATACNHFIEQRAQGGAVIDRSLVGPLRQDQTQTGIDSQEPFEPVTPRHGGAPPCCSRRRMKNVLTAPGAKPVASTATVLWPFPGAGLRL